MKKLILKSILAGLLIGLAACIFMSCENKIIGSCLFSLGLISVIILQANLYTGKIGYVNSKKLAVEAVIILAINLITAYIVGLLYKVCIGNPVQNVEGRFIDFTWYTVLFKSIGTGILIYLGVELYKKTKNLIPVILAVMGFILGGMYHCIADACYLGVSQFSWLNLIYMLLVIIGNSIGSLLVRQIQITFEKETN